MILSCNSCEKKFIVPDNAITSTGRLVQCSSCGNKWKQFPTKDKAKKIEKPILPKPLTRKISKQKKLSKNKNIKKTGPNLYSPEYLAKKHGIKIKSESIAPNNKINKTKNIKLGFYPLVLITFVFIVFVARLIYFTQDQIVEKIPFVENYLDYFFESIKNVKELIQNFFTNY